MSINELDAKHFCRATLSTPCHSIYEYTRSALRIHVGLMSNDLCFPSDLAGACKALCKQKGGLSAQRSCDNHMSGCYSP